MSLFLKLVPEPWASAILAGVLVLAYVYGNVTGKGTERLKNRVAVLEASNKALTKAHDDAMAIQLRMANAASATRLELTDVVAKGVELERRLKASSRGPCLLTDAERLSVKSIHIQRR